MSSFRPWLWRALTRSPLARSIFAVLVAGAIVTLAWPLSLRAQEVERPLPGTVSIAGTVEDEETGEAVEGAVVRLLPDGPDALTNSRGEFRIRDISPGSHELEIHHVGYGTALVPATVQAGESLHLRLRLQAKAVEVAPLEVTVEREYRSNYLVDRGFYEREARGFGHFWTPLELERRNPLRVSHVLQQTPGVRIARDCSSGRCVSFPYMAASAPIATGSFTRKSGGGGRMGSQEETVVDTRGFTHCLANLYVDGHRIRYGGMGIDDLVNTMDLAAIEVYRGASAMAPEFIDSTSRCGVIAIWTKHGPGPRGR